MSDAVERSVPSHYSTQSALQAIRSAREQIPHLGDLLALHEEILALQAKAEEVGESTARSLPRLDDRTRPLADGTPWLRFDDLALHPGGFVDAVLQIAEVLQKYREDWAGQSVQADPEALLALARAAVEGRESLITDEANLTEASVELAIEAEMRQLARRVVPHLGLDQWRRGQCPLCGSPPALSLLEPPVGARSLFCQRCHTSWPFPRTGCPFCPNDVSLTYHTTDNEAYRLYVCPACQQYLKTVDLRRTGGEVNPAVENLLTIGLDLAAKERGYVRAPHR